MKSILPMDLFWDDKKTVDYLLETSFFDLSVLIDSIAFSKNCGKESPDVDEHWRGLINLKRRMGNPLKG